MIYLGFRQTLQWLPTRRKYGRKYTEYGIQTPCGGVVELGKQQGLEDIKTYQVSFSVSSVTSICFSVTCDYCCTWYVEQTRAWLGDTYVFVCPRGWLLCVAQACPLCGTRHLRQRCMTKSPLFRTFLLSSGTTEWFFALLRYKQNTFNDDYFRNASHVIQQIILAW